MRIIDWSSDVSLPILMGVAYNLPIVRVAGEQRRAGLRQITGLKLFYIGLVWVMSSVLLPVAEAYHDNVVIVWPHVWSLMAWVFLFVVAITIPFEIGRASCRVSVCQYE